MRFWALLPAILIWAFTSCGTNHLQDGITLSVTPNQAYLLPGSGSSCTDLITFYNPFIPTGTTTTNPTTPTTIATSISEYRIIFSDFTLTWTSAEKLYISLFRISFKSAQLGSTYTNNLSTTELGALLGYVTSPSKVLDGTVTGAGANTTITVSSSDPNRSKVPGLYPCPLTFGGIAVPANTHSFVGTGEIFVQGYAVDSKGNQRPVATSTTFSAQYFQPPP